MSRRADTVHQRQANFVLTRKLIFLNVMTPFGGRFWGCESDLSPGDTERTKRSPVGTHTFNPN